MSELMPEHDFDWSMQFCRRCGIARLAAVERRTECTDAENVIAISHIVAARRLAKLMGRIGITQ